MYLEQYLLLTKVYQGLYMLTLGRDMAMSGSAQEADILSFRKVHNILEFYTALTWAFLLLTITMTS